MIRFAATGFRRLLNHGPSEPTAHDRQLVRDVRGRADEMRTLTESQLAARTAELREELDGGCDTGADQIVIPGFALVNEAVRRALAMEFYDVQLLAGLCLTRGCVAQMQTGEGKTLVAALPAAIHGLTGRGAHVITSNSYLAGRDYEQLRPVYTLLGLSAGLLEERSAPDVKRAAYACDITYGNGCEFGFDYLRDQVTLRSGVKPRLGTGFRTTLAGGSLPERQTMQRGLPFAIVDEIDSVLIDDAGSPLIISEHSAMPAEDADAHLTAMHLGDGMVEGKDYVVKSMDGQVQLTSAGSKRIYADPDTIPVKVLLRPWSEYVEQALRARLLFREGVHYVVDDDTVRIVDGFTGRIYSERHWRDGLHQAIEAREGITITAEQRGLARITRQRFFRLYDQLCGMTGTAVDSAAEFREFYELPVAVIPLRKPGRRTLLPSRHFATQQAKWDAVVEEIVDVHRTGRPVLVGSRTIANSEVLAPMLEQRGIPFRVLNGKQDDEEASVIARAGHAGAITIATNMAGRGTDIKISREVAELGGLHVIGTERHESRRIDRQLVGRAARQGDPGSARFYAAADDELVARYRPWLAEALRKSAGESGEVTLDFSGNIERLQRHVERLKFGGRRQLFHFDRYRDTVMTKLAGAI